jgi:hypothetical protein
VLATWFAATSLAADASAVAAGVGSVEGVAPAVSSDFFEQAMNRQGTTHRIERKIAFMSDVSF